MFAWCSHIVSQCSLLWHNFERNATQNWYIWWLVYSLSSAMLGKNVIWSNMYTFPLISWVFCQLAVWNLTNYWLQSRSLAKSDPNEASSFHSLSHDLCLLGLVVFCSPSGELTSEQQILCRVPFRALCSLVLILPLLLKAFSFDYSTWAARTWAAAVATAFIDPTHFRVCVCFTSMTSLGSSTTSSSGLAPSGLSVSSASFKASSTFSLDGSPDPS